MKIERTQPALRGARKLAGSLLAVSALFLADNVAQAHLTYSGRDFGAYSGLTNETRSITNQTVTGNYGWADAADGVLGDSHRGRAFRFRLDNAASVTFSVTANPTATTNSIGGFTPAFSIYAGLGAVAPFPQSQTTNAAAADHDGSVPSLAWRTAWVRQNLNPAATDEAPTDGCWNALGDWKIGGDGDLPGDFAQLSSLNYKGSTSSTTSGGTATGSFVLPAGDYTIFVGGNDLANKTGNTALSPHGISTTFSVTPATVLSIAAKVFIAWPAGASADGVLQSSPSLNGGVWTTVTNVPVVVNGTLGVVLDSDEAQKYFRFNLVP